SALLAWLVGQRQADEVRSIVDAARSVVTSSLTFAETSRAILRLERESKVKAGDAQRIRGILGRARASWMGMTISEEILERASRRFPVEPVRTLDAIHLATALEFLKTFPDLRILSFDERILRNAESLGIPA